MWRKLVEAMDHGIFKQDDLLVLPVAAPDNEHIRMARDEMLDRASTDLDLFHIARSVQKHERSAWLLESVRRDATSNTFTLYRVARAYMLLGFADLNPEAEALWEELEARRPIEG